MSKIIEIPRLRYSDWNMQKIKFAYNAGLRGIILNSMGIDLFPVEGARKIGIIVKSLPDYCSDELSDHAFTLLGGLARKIGFEITFEETVLVIGSEGNVGKKVVEKCVARNFKILKHDLALGHSRKGLEKSLAKSDVVFVCIPLTKESSRMFGGGLFFKLKEKKPLIINVSGRMGLFNPIFLLSAVKQGRVKGYACDEDVYDRRFYLHPKMFFTPHIGWKSPASEKKRGFLLKQLWREVEQDLK